MTMHILFLTDNFPPEVNAPASRTFEHCREWVKAGHDVTVITCAPNFPKGELFDGYKNRMWQSEQMAGIRVIRVWSYIARNEGFGKRILDYLSYMTTSFMAGLFVRKVDLIVGTSPQFFTSCSAYGLSVVKRRPWIFELRDIWPESIRAVSAVKKDKLLDLLERLELYLYRKATAVVSVTHAFKRNLVARGVDQSKIYVVTNGVDTSRFVSRPKDPRLVAALGLQGRFVAGYIGTHGMAHGLDTLLDAAALLARDERGRDVTILMLGDGANRAPLETRAKREKLDNILFLDSVSKDEIPRYWSLLDAAVIHLKRNDLFKTVIPSKIFECMGMGIPLLHGVEGESADIVRSNDIGVAFEPENAAALAEQLLALKDNPAELKRFADNGLGAALRYDRKTLADAMLSLLVKSSQR